MLLVLIAGNMTAQTVKNIYRNDGPVVRIPVHLIDTVTTVSTNDGETLNVLQTNGYINQVPLALIDSITHREGSAIDPSQLGALTEASVMGTVVDENGEPVVNAVVRSGYGMEQTTTDINGVFFLDSISVYARLGFIKVEKEGFFVGMRSFIPTEGQRSLLKVELSPRVLVGSFSASAGGTAMAGSFNVSFEPNSIVQNDQPYTGQVNVYAAVFDPIEPTFNDRMPGELIGGMNDTLQMLLSFGMADVEITDAIGQPLQIAEGSTAELTYSIPTLMQNDAPSQTAFWSFDDQAGYWVYEGEAVRSGNTYIGQAAHFSPWNVDLPTQAPGTLTVTCSDAEGLPITGGLIQTSGNTWGSSTAYTNLSGTASILVQPGQSYDIDLKMFCPITGLWDVVNSVTTSPIGAGSTGNDNVSGQLPGQYPVTGTILKCDGDTVKTGYVISSTGGGVHFLEDGTFNFYVCQTGLMNIRAYDTSTDSLKASQVIEVTVGPSGTEIGPITACIDVGHVFVDIEGNVYSTVAIGFQIWMAENLRTTSYANGDPIPNVTNSQWSNLTTGAWAHYNNDSQYENPYGKLYNWYTVNDPRNVCPVGWHVPTDAEWTVLTDYLGGQNVAGGKMKSTGTQYWQSPNTDATNESGFSGLPGGGRGNDGSFYGIGDGGGWWSSTEFNTSNAWGRDLYYYIGNVNRNPYSKGNGFSVRCLRD